MFELVATAVMVTAFIVIAITAIIISR